ncbi:OLC1v1038458C1 [Oldenlandia corymbosa var. corymbosa]|uniref:OLC1v1038458C1 n=1 Tax=Oldenlandia corymbosa var. corymbosa TaxID=529605 RepID=A0AAV1D1D1_OLDCO|nr:OLC1v1038458C1 [Oldenlandia corymbosa var. corymbosa]
MALITAFSHKCRLFQSTLSEAEPEAKASGVFVLRAAIHFPSAQPNNLQHENVSITVPYTKSQQVQFLDFRATVERFDEICRRIEVLRSADNLNVMVHELARLFFCQFRPHFSKDHQSHLLVLVDLDATISARSDPGLDSYGILLRDMQPRVDGEVVASEIPEEIAASNNFEEIRSFLEVRIVSIDDQVSDNCLICAYEPEVGRNIQTELLPWLYFSRAWINSRWLVKLDLMHGITQSLSEIAQFISIAKLKATCFCSSQYSLIASQARVFFCDGTDKRSKNSVVRTNIWFSCQDLNPVLVQEIVSTHPHSVVLPVQQKSGSPKHIPDPQASGSSSRLDQGATEENTLKVKLLEARLESQHSRSRTS